MDPFEARNNTPVYQYTLNWYCSFAVFQLKVSCSCAPCRECNVSNQKYPNSYQLVFRDVWIATELGTVGVTLLVFARSQPSVDNSESQYPTYQPALLNRAWNSAVFWKGICLVGFVKRPIYALLIRWMWLGTDGEIYCPVIAGIFLLLVQVCTSLNRCFVTFLLKTKYLIL